MHDIHGVERLCHRMLGCFETPSPGYVEHHRDTLIGLGLLERRHAVFDGQGQEAKLAPTLALKYACAEARREMSLGRRSGLRSERNR